METRREWMALIQLIYFLIKQQNGWMFNVRQRNPSSFISHQNPPDGPYKADSSDMPNEDYKKFLGSHPQMNVQVAKIYWEVEYIDKRIGELIQQLEEWGIADNTLFIFIGSDNGASGTAKVYNAGMNGQKGHPYQGGTRVPAFFRWPGGGIKSGVESTTLISQMDIMPTLLEITGTPMTDQLKQQVEGRSLIPILRTLRLIGRTTGIWFTYRGCLGTGSGRPIET